MMTKISERIKTHLLQKMRHLPLFWMNLGLMLTIVFFMAAVLLTSNSLYKKSLEERYLSDTQKMLEYNCKTLSEVLYMTYAIPSAMEGTTSYNYIRSISNGTLPKKFEVMLPLISRTLRNQQFLLQSNEECLVYLTGSNSICSRFRSFAKAEDCFNQYIRFSKTTTDEILQLLKARNTVKLLEMQEVSVDGAEPERQMALIIRPIGNRISVMTLYSEKTILGLLGLPYLPENTYVCIQDRDGTVLEEYPSRIDDAVRDNTYSVSANIDCLRAKVIFWIPRTYLSQQMEAVRKTGWGLFVIAILLGIVVCVRFSDLSTSPIPAAVP